MIKIILDKEEWNTVVRRCENYDFYHSYEYHDTLKREGEQSILISYEEGNSLIAIPFLRRPIDSRYYDLTSVHGYVGPIMTNIDDSFDGSKFKDTLSVFLTNENIVSVFSKLNPYIKNQCAILKSIGRTYSAGELIYFDQDLDADSQKSKYNRNTRQKIRQLRETCTVDWANDRKDIDSFINLYHKGMDRLGAKKLFYFDNGYFDALFGSELCEAKILLAKHSENGDTMGGVFCVKTKNIVHIELACTNELYLRQSPVRILFDFCREYYRNDEIIYLNLGGGSGGREGSLMKFKATFTDSFINFHVWNWIVMPQIYTSLLNSEQKKSDSDFFPKYRL